MVDPTPTADLSGSTTTYGPSNPETAPITYSPFSDANIDAAFNSIFTHTPEVDPTPTAYYPSGSTATYGLSNPETGPMVYSLLSDAEIAEIDAAFNSIFTHTSEADPTPTSMPQAG